jgi:2'-5' RNA ligase
VALALELTLDEGADAAVRDVWDGLEQAGVRSLASLLRGRVDPHVSLVVSDDVEALRALAPDLAEIVRMAGPQVLSLDAVGLFPGADPVLYLGVTPTERLLRLHAEVAELLRGRGIEVRPEYLPGAWIPHCTVAMDVPRDRCGDAVAVVGTAALPIRARSARLGLVDSTTGETMFL